MSARDAAIDVPTQDLDLLRQILDGLPLAVFLVDADLRIHQLNEAAAHSLGLDPGSVIRQRAGDALRCFNAACAPQGCGTGEACGGCLVRRTTGNAITEARRITDTAHFEVVDGNNRIVARTLSVTAAPLLAGGTTYVLLTLEDVTELLELRGLIPRCAWCGRVRDDENYWASLEEYLKTQHDLRVSHGICPDCATKLERG